ncbi:nucleotidyltransferase domain-containing protein [Methanofollis formosanus]|nr:nucleotidyltransferase domain-containing protein [Methanofollis formosanus]
MGVGTVYGTIVLEEVRGFAGSHKDVRGMVLTGSWARGEETEQSDLDLFLIARTDPDTLLHDLADAMDAREVIRSKPEKGVFFLGDTYLKADITVVSDTSEIEKMYRGSRITDPSRSVLVDKDGTVRAAVSTWIRPPEIPDLMPEIAKVTESFMEMFELASRYAAQNDAYRFYFTYNIALARYAALLQLQKGNDAYLYTPRSLLEEMDAEGQRAFRNLAASLDLKDAAELLERLSKAFVRAYRHLHSRHPNLPRETKEIYFFLTAIRRRDTIE